MAEGFEAVRGTASGPGLWWGKLPERKSRVLCAVAGNVVEALAYFRDDESFERFTAVMLHLHGQEEAQKEVGNV